MPFPPDEEEPMRIQRAIIALYPALAIAQINYDSGVQPGRITYYSQTPVVACDIPQSLWPQYTAALSEAQFQGGLACGCVARLFSNGKSIDVMIVDLCPKTGNEQWCSGDRHHFDLGGSAAFSQLEPITTGVKELQFLWLPTPVGSSAVKLRFKDGTNPWWVAIQLLNHRYPVAKVEIKNPQSGQWISGDRTKPGMWNYWQFSFGGNGLAAPFQLRITDQYGQVIEENAPVPQSSLQWDGRNQFPPLPQHAALNEPLLQSFRRNSAAMKTVVITRAKQLREAGFAGDALWDLKGRRLSAQRLSCDFTAGNLVAIIECKGE
jgi:hypothetical protein